MIENMHRTKGNVLGFTVSGKLHDNDYKSFIPVLETAIATYGRIRILAHFVDFHGWDMHALWDDIKFAGSHANQVERIALVGDRKWEAWMAKACKPFTAAEVRYFDASDLNAAWAWIEEPVMEPAH